VITTLAGGVGAARFLRGLLAVRPGSEVTAIVNVADDFHLHGLAISPDLDTITYTLAGQVNPETGWGRVGETWRVLDELERYGGQTWFRLGDLDLALHLYRTQRLADGATLSQVTAEVVAAHGLGLTLLPVSDDTIQTRLVVPGEGTIDFQEWFVARRHQPPVEAVEFAGGTSARPAPGVIDAIESADVIVIAPSNPVVSIGPVLAVPGVSEAVCARRDRTVAISPIIGGRALKGPAAELLTGLGWESSVVGIARWYAAEAATLVIDEVDAAHAPAVEEEGLRCVVAQTVMHDAVAAAALASVVLEARR
jgi:LPPG:FO 2-phospho-L-lactate transferase